MQDEPPITRRASCSLVQTQGPILPDLTSRRFDDRQVLLWITIAVVAGGLVYLLAPILSPFLFAAILAYICNPLVERMANRKVPRSVAAAAVLVLLAALTA